MAGLRWMSPGATARASCARSPSRAIVTSRSRRCWRGSPRPLQPDRHIELRFPSMNRFAGKSVLVTGAGSGIGRATAIAFSAEGARLIVTDINDSAGQSTVALLRERGGEADFVH